MKYAALHPNLLEVAWLLAVAVALKMLTCLENTFANYSPSSNEEVGNAMELHLLNHVGFSGEAVKVNCSPSLVGARWLVRECLQTNLCFPCKQSGRDQGAAPRVPVTNFTQKTSPTTHQLFWGMHILL